MTFLKKLLALVPFNQGKPGVQAGVLLLILLLVIGFATKCGAAEPAYIQMGPGVTTVRGSAPALSLAVVYPKRVGDADYEIGVTFIGASTFNNDLQQNNFAWNASLIEKLWKLDVGLGAAYLQNTDEYNGSHLNFHLVLGYRFEKIPVTLRWTHFSNGGTQAPNRGRDMILAFWRF